MGFRAGTKLIGLDEEINPLGLCGAFAFKEQGLGNIESRMHRAGLVLAALAGIASSLPTSELKPPTIASSAVVTVTATVTSNYTTNAIVETPQGYIAIPWYVLFVVLPVTFLLLVVALVITCSRRRRDAKIRKALLEDSPQNKYASYGSANNITHHASISSSSPSQARQVRISTNKCLQKLDRTPVPNTSMSPQDPIYATVVGLPYRPREKTPPTEEVLYATLQDPNKRKVDFKEESANVKAEDNQPIYANLVDFGARRSLVREETASDIDRRESSTTWLSSRKDSASSYQTATSDTSDLERAESLNHEIVRSMSLNNNPMSNTQV
eukprot:Colp12_sorted_trinity150504_noHs@22756